MPENNLKIYELPDLLALVNDWRQQGLKTGFTCGSFDLLHAGHVDYLNAARALCDRLVVAVNSDESVRSYKSPLRPIVTEDHRIKVVSALACVDAIILMHQTRPATLIAQLHPDFYIKGGDYQVSDMKSASLVEAYGGKCAVIPVRYPISTSEIIRRIQELALYAAPAGAAEDLHGPLVVLDRDGTLIEDKHFLRDPAEVRLLPGVGSGLQKLQDAGFSLAVTTNQQGIGLGYFEYESFVAVNSAMLRQLAPFHVRIAKFYFCPHSMAQECNCRKPAPGMIARALTDFHCDVSQCFVLGDSIADMQAASSAGVTGILVAGGAASFDTAVEKVLSSRFVPEKA